MQGIFGLKVATQKNSRIHLKVFESGLIDISYKNG